MSKEAGHFSGSPDCVSFLDGTDTMMRLPHSRDVELLLSDGMVDEIGRALEDYPFGNPLSVCPSPRTESPWPFAPGLVSSSSSSTLFSNPENQLHGGELSKKRKATGKKKRSPLADGNVSASSTDTDSTSDQIAAVKRSKKRPGPSGLSAEDDLDHLDDHPAPKKKKSKPVDPNRALSERSRKSSSTYRGVSLCTKDSRWQARIRIKKEVVYLGRFETEEAAARRYDDAAREHHGDKALINFITPEDRALGRKCVFEQAGGKSARV
jgi:hypothetical protein